MNPLKWTFLLPLTVALLLRAKHKEADRNLLADILAKAENGDAECQYVLGFSFTYGRLGVSQDYVFRVTEKLDASSGWSTAARLVFMRVAICVLGNSSSFKRRSSCRPNLCCRARALTSSKRPGSFGKSRKSLPRCLFFSASLSVSNLWDFPPVQGTRELLGPENSH